MWLFHSYHLLRAARAGKGERGQGGKGKGGVNPPQPTVSSEALPAQLPHEQVQSLQQAVRSAQQGHIQEVISPGRAKALQRARD